jgi:hypothetical protein
MTSQVFGTRTPKRRSARSAMIGDCSAVRGSRW